MKWFQFLLGQRLMLLLVLAVNFLGTVYGYYWYLPQLLETPARFLVFVPDSPTATFFFLFVLLSFLMKRNAKLFEALALVTLVKYGLWAVGMNLLILFVTGELPWQGYMLIGSHFAMAVQGVLYSPYFRFRLWHLVLAAIWTLHNDVIDYLFGMMPQYSMLSDYMTYIGYATFWLSLFSIALAYYLVVSKKQMKLDLP
ncbi:lipoprotein heptaprenylglyceryl N-acetyltransferase LhaT [Bacillus atrophaeus]